jgi:hypothetical protein
MQIKDLKPYKVMEKYVKILSAKWNMFASRNVKG